MARSGEDGVIVRDIVGRVVSVLRFPPHRFQQGAVGFHSFHAIDETVGIDIDQPGQREGQRSHDAFSSARYAFTSSAV